MTSSMAEVSSYLRLPQPVEDFEQEDIFSSDSLFPFFSLDDLHAPAAFDRGISDWISESGYVSFDESPDTDNQVTFVLDLLQHRVDQPQSLEIGSFEPVPILEYDFGFIDRNVEQIGGNCYELDQGDFLGLGIAGGDHQDGNCGGSVVSDCGNELIVARERNRASGGSNSVDFDSDSEEDLVEAELCLEDENRDSGDISMGFCWDSLQLEDHGNDEFEWEEVDGAVEVLPTAGPQEEEQDQIEEPRSRNLEWEVLLNVSNLDRNPDAENNEGPYFFGGNDDHIYTAEYEMTIGLAVVERPPASKLAVESLGCVTVTDEDVVNGNAVCVVCKDDMGVGEQAIQLPCSHSYHGDCIVPWLEISNTCPVCRHELPTDDPDYEQRRATGAHAQ